MQKTFVFLSIKTVLGELVSIGAATSTGKYAYLYISDFPDRNYLSDDDSLVLKFRHVPPPIQIEDNEFVSGSLFVDGNFYSRYPAKEIGTGFAYLAQWLVSLGPFVEIWSDTMKGCGIFYDQVDRAIHDHVAKLPDDHLMKAAPFDGFPIKTLELALRISGSELVLPDFVGERIPEIPIRFHPFPNEQDFVRYPENMTEAWQFSHQAVYSAILIREGFSKLYGIATSVHQLKETDENIVPVSPINPAHYRDGKWELIDFIEDQGFDYVLGNAVRLIVKAGKEDTERGKIAENLQQAIWYIDRCIRQCMQGQRQHHFRGHFIKAAEFCQSANLDDQQTAAIIKICDFQQIHGRDYMHHVGLLQFAKTAILKMIERLTK